MIEVSFAGYIKDRHLRPPAGMDVIDIKTGVELTVNQDNAAIYKFPAMQEPMFTMDSGCTLKAKGVVQGKAVPVAVTGVVDKKFLVSEIFEGTELSLDSNPTVYKSLQMKTSSQRAVLIQLNPGETVTAAGTPVEIAKEGE